MKNQELADRAFVALTLWREARGESKEVQIAIAHVIKSRTLRPGWWGKNIMGVVFCKMQFSSLTDPHDQQLTRWPEAEDASWKQCLDVSCDVLDGLIDNPAPGADSYYDISIPPPKWADSKKFIKQIGTIRFYDLYSNF